MLNCSTWKNKQKQTPPSQKMDPAKIQVFILAEKANWPKPGNCQTCGRTPHANCYYGSAGKYMMIYGNSESLPWNKSKQGIAFYKLGYFSAKKFWRTGYDQANKVLTAHAAIKNTQAPKGVYNNNSVYKVNLLKSDNLKPRADVHFTAE